MNACGHTTTTIVWWLQCTESSLWQCTGAAQQTDRRQMRLSLSSSHLDLQQKFHYLCQNEVDINVIIIISLGGLPSKLRFTLCKNFTSWSTYGSNLPFSRFKHSSPQRSEIREPDKGKTSHSKMDKFSKTCQKEFDLVRFPNCHECLPVASGLGNLTTFDPHPF